MYKPTAVLGVPAAKWGENTWQENSPESFGVATRAAG